jgi:hypothetical protein
VVPKTCRHRRLNNNPRLLVRFSTTDGDGDDDDDDNDDDDDDTSKPP